jgi:hypothetical protein
MGGRHRLEQILVGVTQRVQLGIACLTACLEMRCLGDLAGTEHPHA